LIRKGVIKAVLGAALVLASMASIGSPTQCAPKSFLLGADLSQLKMDEDAGVVYTDNGQPSDCIRIFKNHGWNMVRLRLWVNPSGQNGLVNDLAYDGALAQRAKAAGMKVMLDIHYSDSWTDAGTQTKPAAWAADTFDTPNKLYNDVFWYTSNVVYTMAHVYHAAPDYVEVGNEITYGMLWPDGYLGAVPGKWTNWTKYATLVNKAIEGADRGARKAGIPFPEIIIHISMGMYWGVVDGFFSGLTSAQDIYGHPVQFDLIGLSYYPDDKTNLSDIKETLKKCADKYGKPIIICETSYQYRGTDGPNTGPYPQTPEGQASYLSKLSEAVRDTPNGLGAGVCYWEPEAVPNAVSRAFAPGGWRDSGWSALFDTETHDANPAIANAGESAHASR